MGFSFKRIIEDLFYENGEMSMTRVIAFIGYVVFIVGSFYLLLNNIAWDSYSVFASYTGGGGAAVQVANKFINSKYNSAPGTYEHASRTSSTPNVTNDHK